VYTVRGNVYVFNIMKILSRKWIRLCHYEDPVQENEYGCVILILYGGEDPVQENEWGFFIMNILQKKTDKVLPSVHMNT
jgi:hypothetical protein